MEATLLVAVPEPRLTPDHLLFVIESKGIVFGVDPAAVQRVVDRCRTSRERIEEIVARGTPMKQAQAGYGEVLVREGEKVAISESGRADFRNIAKYHSVKKGDLLFRNIAPVVGEPGMDVYGRTRQSKMGPDRRLRAGENVGPGAEPGQFVALVDGLFERQGDTIHVRTELRIERDAGLATGNLVFQGPIVIGGNVEKGTTIQCNSLKVGGLVESGHIAVAGPCHVEGGVNTGRDGTLYVRGNLEAGFLDNSTIVCHGHMQIARSILSSRVICYDRITLGTASSTIAGGELISFGAVEADHIGNRTGISTKITLGIHYGKEKAYDALSRDVEFLENQVGELAQTLKEFRAWIPRQRGNIPAEKRIEMQSTFQAYREKLAVLQTSQADLQRLLRGRFNTESVRLVAREMLHPGVEIHYRHHVERIVAPLTKCILVFSPGADKPEILAYTAPDASGHRGS